MINTDEFYQWKQFEVTKAFFEAMNFQFDGVVAEMIAPQADTDLDQFRRGYLQAIRDIQDYRPEED